MWARLDDDNLVDRYRSGFFESEAEPTGVAELLSKLHGCAFASRVWAVTTHNVLRFTTAPSYAVEEKHATVWVSRVGRDFEISYAQPAATETTEPMTCTEDALVPTVIRYIEERLPDGAESHD